MLVSACALLGAQAAHAAAQSGKWYVFQSGGIARVDTPPASVLDPAADSFVDSERTANGQPPGRLNTLNQRAELVVEPGATTNLFCVANASETYSSKDPEGQGYHYARFSDFAVSTQAGATNSLYVVIRKGDAGDAQAFQSDLYMGFDRNTNYLERDLLTVPFNLAKATVAFRSMQGVEKLTCLYASADSTDGSALASPYEFNAVNAQPRTRTLTVPARPNNFQLVKITVAQGTNSAVIQATAYYFTDWADLQTPANWRIFAQTAPATVAGGPASLAPYFSGARVPDQAGVDNAIFALKVE